MKKDELLDYLRLAFGYEDDSEKFNQAYQQIVVLIKKPEAPHGTLHLLQKQNTEEWIEKKTKEFWDIPYYDCALQDVKDFIRSLVEEIAGK